MSDTPELDYGAFSLDTDVIERNAFRFSQGNLKEMSQFKNSPVRVIQTEIVHQECLAHYSKQLSTANQEIQSAMRTARIHLHVDDESIDRAKKALSLSESAPLVAEKRLATFYDAIGAEVLPCSHQNILSRLVPMYFGGSPPFEKTGDKKHEFPDALALLSLEAWANENDTNVLVVSHDKGWSKYASTSPRITVVDKLGEALERFQPHTKVQEIIAKIKEDELLDHDNHVVDSIRDEIASQIGATLPWVDADSSFIIEEQYADAEYAGHDFERSEDGTVHINVVRISGTEVVIEVEAIVDISINAEFSFSARDPIDKDYLSVGSNSYKLKHEVSTDVVVTLTGDFSKGIDHIQASEVDASEPEIDIHLGAIEPSWRADPEAYL